MGSTSTNGMTNGELERSDTAPWASGGGGAASAADAARAKSAKKPKNGKRTGKGSLSDRSKVWILLDRSGSMSGLETSVVQGVNRFIAEQAAEPGKCKITLVQFDSEEPFEVLAEAVSVHKASPLSVEQYRPRAATPLLDAVGSLVGCADQRAKQRRKSSKQPEDQTVVIVTDGLENASTDFDWDDIHRLISDRRERGWAFVFMGANQDSYSEGARLGVDPGNVQSYEASDEGVDEAFASMSRAQRDRRAMSSSEREARRDDYFGGVREAEEGMRRRSA